jgi:hypothetical protein
MKLAHFFKWRRGSLNLFRIGGDRRGLLSYIGGLMTDQPLPEKSGARNPAEISGGAASAGASVPVENKPVGQLTPEEQMALFEKDLKENDWGHQPC